MFIMLIGVMPDVDFLYIQNREAISEMMDNVNLPGAVN